MENEPPTTPPQTGPEPPATDPNTPTPPAANTDAPTPNTQAETAQTPEKKPNSLFNILVPIIAVIALGLALFLTLGPKNNPSPNPSNPDNPADSPDTPEPEDEKISVNWFDGSTPGNNYAVTINSKTGEFHFEKTPGCSTVECLEGDEWPETIKKNGTFLKEDLEKILKVYDNLDFKNEEEDSLHKDFWFAAISSIADGDIIIYACAEEINPDDVAICNQKDLNSDGIVTGRESGLETLNYLIDEANQ